MDLSVLLNETLPNLIFPTISGAVVSYMGYRLGIKEVIKSGSVVKLYEMIDTNNPRFSPLELAKCKNIMDIGKLAQTYRKIENTSGVEFSFEWFDRFFEIFLKKESQTGLINYKPFNFLILRLYFLTCLVDFKIGMYSPLGSVISPLSAFRENIRSSSKALTRRSSALSLKNLIIPILTPPQKEKNEIEQLQSTGL